MSALSGLWPNLRDPRGLCLGAAFACLFAAVLAPTLEIERPAYDVLVVVDITGSMNARDYTLDGRPISRLDKVKRVLRDLILRLPCGSRMGLAIFTERRTFLLFEPVDICGAFAPLDGALAALDWRMGWEGDSHVAAGLHSALGLAEGVGAELVFLTDGHEAPPLPHSGPPRYEGKLGGIRGLVVGVGGTALVPIPKFDADGREIGFWAMTDVPQENRSGPPPEGAETREGYHPRNAPFGAEAAVGEEHLTSVREGHLRALAEATGLGYAPLTEAPALAEAIVRVARPRPLRAPVDPAPLPAAAALLLFVVLFAVLPFLERHPGHFYRKPRNIS